MIAALSSFSLFTAYQFLSPGNLVFAPENKTQPFPSCVCQWLCAYMMEMIATSFFFGYCVSIFELLFLFSRGLDNRLNKSYNTTPTEEGMKCASLLRPRGLTM